jgi:hypothetical protein
MILGQYFMEVMMKKNFAKVFIATALATSILGSPVVAKKTNPELVKLFDFETPIENPQAKLEAYKKKHVALLKQAKTLNKELRKQDMPLKEANPILFEMIQEPLAKMLGVKSARKTKMIMTNDVMSQICGVYITKKWTGYTLYINRDVALRGEFNIIPEFSLSAFAETYKVTEQHIAGLQRTTNLTNDMIVSLVAFHGAHIANKQVPLHKKLLKIMKTTYNGIVITENQLFIELNALDQVRAMGINLINDEYEMLDMSGEACGHRACALALMLAVGTKAIELISIQTPEDLKNVYTALSEYFPLPEMPNMENVKIPGLDLANLPTV